MKPKNPIFEGGAIALHSGGVGPDDYILRRIGTRKWYGVVYRWGRNFGYGNLEAHAIGIHTVLRKAAAENDSDCKILLEQMQTAAREDRMVMQTIVSRTNAISVTANAETYSKLLATGKILQFIPAAEFAKLFEKELQDE